VICLAPRVPGEIVGPRRLSGVVVRPLNFTVRPPMTRRRKSSLRTLTSNLCHIRGKQYADHDI